MSTFTNTTKSSAPAFSNATRNTATLSNVSKSGVVFGTLTIDQLSANTFDGLYHGKPLGDYYFDEIIPPDWTATNKN